VVLFDKLGFTDELSLLASSEELSIIEGPTFISR
jgi:hypothetical protein